MANLSTERTTITVPKGMVDTLQEMTQASSKTEAVLIAIQEEIKRRKLSDFRALAGKISLRKSILKGRHADHRLR